MLHATIDLIRVNERMSEDRNRNTDKDGEKTNEREIQTRLIYKGEKKEKEGKKSLKKGAWHGTSVSITAATWEVHSSNPAAAPIFSSDYHYRFSFFQLLNILWLNKKILDKVEIIVSRKRKAFSHSATTAGSV